MIYDETIIFWGEMHNLMLFEMCYMIVSTL